MVRLLGLDPGLRFTGWGLIESDGNRLRHLADGVIATDSSESVMSCAGLAIGSLVGRVKSTGRRLGLRGLLAGHGGTTVRR